MAEFIAHPLAKQKVGGSKNSLSVEFKFTIADYVRVRSDICFI